MKRSNSAPLIPDLIQQAEDVKQPPPPTSSNLLFRRGMSTSNVCLPTEVTIKTKNIGSSPRKQVRTCVVCMYVYPSVCYTIVAIHAYI